eukprot:1270005-Pyramimonas_sp.AAC.1
MPFHGARTPTTSSRMRISPSHDGRLGARAHATGEVATAGAATTTYRVERKRTRGTCGYATGASSRQSMAVQ